MEWMAAVRHTLVLALLSGEKEEYGFSFIYKYYDQAAIDYSI